MRQFWARAAGLTLAALAGCRSVTPAGPALTVKPLDGSPASVAIVLSGLSLEASARAQALSPEELPSLLSLYVGAETHSPDQPPVVGTYQVAGGRVVLEPRYPLQRGLSYHAAAFPEVLVSNSVPHPPLMARFTVPALSQKPKRSVAHIYPSADVLPENLLKFYLHFSGPMSRGGIYQYIKLLKSDGTPLDLPFLEIGEELWDRDLTRLTLLIDPGRIKREINPIENLGPALLAGEEFVLVIDGAWPDADGVPLRATHRKRFRVVSPDRVPPDPDAWQIATPKLKTRQPLSLQFSKPMDHALASRLIHVRVPGGAALAGRVHLTDHERRWEFVPDQPWRDEEYQIVAAQILEDWAGNSLGKPFEVDVAQPLNPPPPTTLRFRPR